MEFPLLTFEITILGLLLVACLAAIGLKRIHFPYTVGLVIVGFLIRLVGDRVPEETLLVNLELSHDAILFLFLPPLVFESALNLNARLLMRNIGPVLTLAIPGLLIATGVVGAMMASLTSLSWTESLLFGALISATDPVAVVALFKELGVAQQLVVLMEGESLLNDATAIVIFNLILAAVTAPVDGSLITQGGREFFVSFFGGILVGVIAAWLASYLLSLAQRRPLIQSTFSLILAYGVFILAEHFLHISGVIAVVSAGLVTSWLISLQLKPETRSFLKEFWEYISFLANSLIFLLVGIATAKVLGEVDGMGALGLGLGVAIAAVFLSRAIVIFGLLPLTNRFHAAPTVNRPEQAILFWGGLRGAVALALALSLNPAQVSRDFVIALTLGVALFTLLIPGTTIGWLVRRLGLDKPTILDQIEQAEALSAAHQRALKALDHFHPIAGRHEGEIHAERQQSQQALDRASQQLNDLWQSLEKDLPMLNQAMWLQALMIEQKGYRRLHDQGFISEAALLRLEVGVSIRQDAVLAGQLPPPALAPTTLMTRLEYSLIKGLRQLLPTTRWRRQQSLKFSNEEYECDLAIAQISESVLDRLRELIYGEKKAARLMAACLDFYTQASQTAQARLTDCAQRHSAAVQQFERRIAARVASLGREEAIANLVEAGAISESVAQTVCDQID